jgi:phosphatidylglycerol:prolipoprotein diacylglycerol transferase
VNGFVVGIEPVIFRLGPVTVRWFGVLLLVALAVGLRLSLRRAARGGLPRSAVLDVASWALLAGLLGARLVHLLEHAEYYATRPDMLLDLSAGGMSVWGGYAFGSLAGLIAAKRRGLNCMRLADAVALALPLAEAIGRVGCFINGDGQGRATSLPWATRYTSSDALTPEFGLPRHPAQVYQGLADLLVLGLVAVVPGSWPAGSRYWTWLGCYGLSRVLIGGVRLEPEVVFGLASSQLFGLAAVLVAAVAMIRSVRPAAPVRAGRTIR